MPPALDKSTRLKVGDHVSVAVRHFGEDYAKGRGARPWTSESVRDEGKIVGREDNKWKVKFEADDVEHLFKREDLAFLGRDEQPQRAGGRRATAVDHDGSSDEEERQPQAPTVDSSDEDNGVGEAEHEGGAAAAANVDVSEWTRDDDYGVDERSKHGFTDQYGPRLNNLASWETASLFTLALHFLPLAFLTAMAAKMQEKGRAKAAAGDRNYINWTVTLDDIFQWIGVWIYMLAFPQAGARRDYFTERPGGYGPRHRISDYLRLGRNGEKGLQWFQKMQDCFTLPSYGDERNPFNPTRRWWESLRDGFYNAVTWSWLMTLDESMIRWMGVGMPGLMVILRKPTPIGLELHTLCCALCGILIWFEVYEGKDAMAKKEYCDRYPKSVALTLRMLKPFFSTGRVLIADSWYGSVACALALFQHGLFAVMNVKTNTKGYPKDELMAEVDEIKGKTDEARQRRRERRGKQIAFVKTVKVGSRQVTLTAGGHNKKVPLLLISTALSMLPGTEHLKTCQVNKTDGSVEYRSIRTKQPMMHALYRKWMNVVDVLNKLFARGS